MKIVRLVCLLAGIYIVTVLLLGVFYLVITPPSTLMLAQWAMLQHVEHESVSLSRISPHLLRAIVRAEDSRFCQHGGVDWKGMETARQEKRKNGKSRGASTISMQVAKNLFLWPHRSYLRKAIEIPIAIYLDAIWPKSRMMEVYLSIAEWGDGVYGIEAAAQIYFHKSADSLTSREAALLAAALPNPLQRRPDRPSAYHVGYAGRIQSSAYGADISCLKRLD